MMIETHKGILYKVANAYCNDSEDRKDLVQEMVLQLWRSFDQYNNAFKFSTWVYRVALNVAISFYRKESRRKKVVYPISIELQGIAAAAVPPDDAANLAILHQFIAGLKEVDKALMLLYLDETSYSEIAGIMGISQTNVATKIGRIKQRLKQYFSTR